MNLRAHNIVCKAFCEEEEKRFIYTNTGLLFKFFSAANLNKTLEAVICDVREQRFLSILYIIISLHIL